MSSTAPSRSDAPVAKKVDITRTHHGDTVVDEYEWLRDKDDPEVIDYLEQQNAFTEHHTSGLAELRGQLFDEIKSRTQETDMSVPSRRGDWWYYSRTVTGQQYAVRCRCPIKGLDDWTPPAVEPGSAVVGEQILLDANVEAEGFDFFSLGAFSVSDDGNLLAYSVDTTGNERYTLRFKDLRTGDLLDDVVSDTAPGATWSADGEHVFYQTVDASWRPDTVWRHDLGAGTPDATVFHEPDDRFWVGVGGTRSDKYLMITLGSKITSEVLVLEADDPTGEFRVVLPRREGVEYGVEHAVINGADKFLILHNENAENFAVTVAPVDDPSGGEVLVEHDSAIRIEDIDAFADQLVLSYRRDALPRIAIADLSKRDVVFDEVEFDQELCSVGLAANPEWSAPRLRIGYTSFVDPTELLELDVPTGERILLKRQPVLGGYDPAQYEAHREWAVAQDGTRIPLSIVRRRDVQRPAPLLLYGYGSYEASMDPSFSVSRLSMLDRGVVFVITHIRGGGEMGRHWYDNGKTLTKKNTFTDFVDSARYLVDAGWTTPQQQVGMGGSAGGLLIGAVVNLAPELFNGIVAAVPFVDPLTSILDPSLPLTVIEWDEWGNPLADAEVYEYMKSYSPYENVGEKDYPAILAITSLNDTRVLYTEAAKWVARLQERTTGEAPILLKTEMQAGHGGVSGRYKQWEEVAFEDAWILRQTGAVHP
ncbi:S9 family peptidase [Williamsia sterculiae]|uniref:Oligopeptidase B Serine peptidase. MEROPS family S09A n=1 Tax=Williamsia sterculiae TaxID=1344003 RepID=A0A1N7GYE9_9NOCA|nr:S9 family peptidase [Williamsia sterculiae]SIS17614.1 oligopeptidase B Serine peptidase. MEROPS family S09A [Williamsia sterculiae]